MEAARVAALMGHQVTLIEKEKMLGGHMIESTKQEFKANEAELFKWLVTQVKKSGVKNIVKYTGYPGAYSPGKTRFFNIGCGFRIHTSGHTWCRKRPLSRRCPGEYFTGR